MPGFFQFMHSRMSPNAGMRAITAQRAVIVGVAGNMSELAARRAVIIRIIA
ncbi:hypothetical protein D3C85_1852110 [compost metagenome]